jgi:uncharacterized damage-inducible protein DinB
VSDQNLRQHALDALAAKNAHIMFDDVVADFPAEHRGTKVAGVAHSAWQLLEHLRICQWDILEFSRNPEHVSPTYPDGYWPDDEAPPNDQAWEQSVTQFRKDIEAMQALLAADDADLTAPIPHGDGQTLLREALVLAKHNSYHLGQLAMIKRLVGVKS